MTNDDRKNLEDRICDYAIAIRDGSDKVVERAWDRVSRVLTKLEKEQSRR